MTRTQTLHEAALVIAQSNDPPSLFDAHKRRLERAGFNLRTSEILEAIIIARRMRRAA